MPGFLGTDKQFTERFSKPITAMKGLGGKLISSNSHAETNKKQAQQAAKVQEAGTLALESLHRQVLPFLLRRLKEQVLHDLPPKIIQDYYCDLSWIQQLLYDEFTREHIAQISLSLQGEKGRGSGGNVFQALQYLRKLCNHPSLVVNNTHPLYDRIVQQVVQETGSPNLRDLRFSPKLTALKELLQQCGIGAEDQDAADVTVSPHRALIFCQLKSMVDFVEFDLLQKTMPNVSYLRLDGSTDPAKRHEMVTKFNSDPSIDVLLLTTNVGGLGLNLTGAGGCICG